MRLAFCLFRYSPFSGLARDMLRIADAAVDRGHQLTIFTTQWRSDASQSHAVEILKVSARTNHARSLAFSNAIASSLGKQFDAVVGFNKMHGLDFYYAADPCFAARAHYNRKYWYRFTPRYRTYRGLEESVFSPDSSTRIFVLSNRARSEYQEFYATPDSRFTLLPPVLDSKFRQAPKPDKASSTRAELGLGARDIMILAVGSGFITKGVDRSIIAVSSLPAELSAQTHLFVVGEGKDSTYSALAEKLDVSMRVKFLGGRSDIRELMAAADLLLHPARTENTGTVLLEAMAMGLPVLTTAVCGYATHVTGANAGIVLPIPFSQNLLNKTLQEMLLTDPASWRINGRAYLQSGLFYSMPDRVLDSIQDVRTFSDIRPTKNFLYVSDRLPIDRDNDTVDRVFALRGETFRQAPGRRTFRFEINGEGYFVKTHSGVGWKEILKNLISLKLPVLGAANEWHALHVLSRAGVRVPEPLAYGVQGRNPARRKSFIIMSEVTDAISLEDLSNSIDSDTKSGGRQLNCSVSLHSEEDPHGSAAPNRTSLHRSLIAALADIARTLHQHGVNHRDFYLCHFLVDSQALEPGMSRSTLSSITLIDLHRAQIRQITPRRWVIKDLGALYYSAMHIELSRNDLFRFIKRYADQPLRVALQDSADWRRVERRAKKLYLASNAAATNSEPPVG